MILNSSFIYLSIGCSLRTSPFFALPITMTNSQFYFNFFSYKNMYSSFLRGSPHSALFFSNGQFSHLLSPAIYISNNEDTVIQDATFHKQQFNFSSGIKIINCTFTYCSQSDTEIQDGGALAINSHISFEVKYCLFRQNSAHRNGGAISVEQSPLVKIKSCLFAENSCTDNGALNIHVCGEANIKQSNFTLNKSGMSVGAVCISEISEGFNFSFCTLSENSARMSGTLYLHDTIGEVKDCNFYSNKILHRAVSIKTLDDVTLKIERTAFSEESSPCVSFSSGNHIEIIQCRFAHSKKSDIDKNFAKLIVREDNEFNSILPYSKIILPPLKPLYENDDVSIVEEDRRKNIKNRFPKKVKKNITITPELDIDTDSKVNDEPPSHYSSFYMIIVLLIIAGSLFMLLIGKKKDSRKGFANLQRQSNSILNDYDTRKNNDFSEDAEITNVKFETNDDDLPNLQMEKY